MNLRNLTAFTLILILTIASGCQTQVAQSSITSNTASNISNSIQISDFVTSLSIPWEMVFLPDDRILITERQGNIRVIQNEQLQPEPWMNINVAARGEGGLLGIDKDPNFKDNHYLYIAYTYEDDNGDLKNRLSRIREDTTTGQGIEDKVLLEGGGGSIHDGGRVKFGPDGKLYWTLGEIGNPDLSQDISSLNGKILRINSDGTIPQDNPFPNSPVYSYGHRNPEGIAWAPVTNLLYATEHGPSGGQYGVGQDEINYIQAGNNYGWPVIHGNMIQNGMISPIKQSGSSETWAPAGCCFVSGGLWDGSFLFAGLAGRSLYRVTMDKNDPTAILSFERLFTNQFGRLRNVSQGPDGSIYILTNNTDGRGNPKSGDDRILKINFTQN